MKIVLILFLISFGLLAHARQIIGIDTRTRILSHEQEIHKNVGLVEYEGMFCTGTLITRRHVLTNGHCVTGIDKFPSTIVNPALVKFTPGKLSEDSAPFGIFTGKKIHTFKQWVEKGLTNFDVALIELSANVPLNGVKIFLQKKPEKLEGLDIMLTGYSSKRDMGTMWEGFGKYAASMEDGRLLHSADTLPGTSGSLVRAKINNKWVPVGIHRGWIHGISETNVGVIFNKTVFDAINRWIKK